MVPQRIDAATRRRALVVTFGSVRRPRSGLPVRTRMTVEMLRRLGFDVEVLSTAEPTDAPDPPGATVDVVRGPAPWTWTAGMARAVRSRRGSVDVVVVCTALLLPGVIMGRPDAPVVWDTNECETLHYQRLPRTPRVVVLGFVWRRLERWSARHSDIAVAVGEAEAAWWRRLVPAVASRLRVVDHAPPLGSPRARPGERTASRPVLAFAGSLNAKHNRAAARWLLEALAPLLPATATLVLAGEGTAGLRPPQVAARVELLGEVDDIDAVLARADLCLAPLAAGAGVKTKVLHYLAAGRPVVATPAAMEGLDGAPGCEVAEPDQLAALVLRRLGVETPPGLAAEQGAWLERHHGEAHVLEQWRHVMAALSLP